MDPNRQQSVQEIEELVQIARMSGLILRIKLKDLGEKCVCVERYDRREGLKLVELKPRTLYGEELAITVFHLTDIQSAALLNINYDSPHHQKIRRLKKIFE